MLYMLILQKQSGILKNRRCFILEIRVLKYFLMVAREENITKAANLLHLTQPTLSRQLMQLETELGVSLFHRSNCRVLNFLHSFSLRSRTIIHSSLLPSTAATPITLRNVLSGDFWMSAFYRSPSILPNTTSFARRFGNNGVF